MNVVASGKEIASEGLAVSPSSPPQGSGQDDGQVNVSEVSAAIEYCEGVGLWEGTRLCRTR